MIVIYGDIFKELYFSSLFKNYNLNDQHAFNPVIVFSILITLTGMVFSVLVFLSLNVTLILVLCISHI